MAATEGPVAEFSSFANFEERKRKSNEEVTFSNSLIIHAALIQPEHRILVRWMSLETQ